MPNFFDFSNAGAGPLTAPGQQGWMQNILGQDEPIAPETNDIFGASDIYDSTGLPGSDGPQVPFNAMAAMSGIQMPNMPQVDQYGRYGLNDAQMGRADDLSLSHVLAGAAQSMMGGGPNPALQAGMQSGQIRDQVLDKYSAQNIADYKLRVEAEAKKLDFIGKMSDVQRQQGVIEAEKMKLDQLHTTRKIASQFAQEMEPVVARTLQQARELYPDKVEAIKSKFLAAKEQLNLGNMEEADKMFEMAANELPVNMQAKIKEDIIQQTFTAATKFGMGAELMNDPSFRATAQAAGMTIEMGPDGIPKLLTQQDLTEREMRNQLIQSQIAAQRANAAQSYATADYYRNGGSGGGQQKGALNQNQVMGYVDAFDQAVATLLNPPVDSTTDAAQRARNEAIAAVSKIGIDNPGDIVKLQNWLKMNPNDKAAFIKSMASGTGMSLASGGSGGKVLAGPVPSYPPQNWNQGAPQASPQGRPGGANVAATRANARALAAQPDLTIDEAKRELARIAGVSKDPMAVKASLAAIRDGGGDPRATAALFSRYLETGIPK